VGFNDLSVPVTGLNLSEEVERFEKSLLCAALKQCQGRQVKAAELLGIRPTTLSAKLLRYDIDAKAFKRAARKH
jgi:two-component system response regulator PilR (NtrC family)